MWDKIDKSKRFNEYLETFISYIKGKNCPYFTTYQFSFEYQDENEINEQLNIIIDVEKKFNQLLDKGHSWINFVCKKISGNCLFIAFEISKANYPECVGRTSVNICGPNMNLNGDLLWDGEYTENI